MNCDKYVVNYGVITHPVKPRANIDMGNVNEVEEYALKLKKYSEELKVYKERRTELDKKQCELYKQFAKDLAKENGIDHFPAIITDRVYSMAWEYGHSSGLCEVANYYSEFAEFAEFIYNEIVKANYGR